MMQAQKGSSAPPDAPGCLQFNPELEPTAVVPRPQHRRWLLAACVALPLTASTGCHVKQRVLNSTIDALTTGTGGFGTEDDPELVRDAVPFGLKTLESLYGESPDHPGLNLALASGFTQYAYAFVQLDGDLVKFEDYDVYKAQRARAHRLYLRALGYGKHAVELSHPGFFDKLETDAQVALDAQNHTPTVLDELTVEDVPAIYWAGAAWAAAIASNPNDLGLLADLTEVRALLARGRSLEPGYEAGAFHELFISLEMAPSGGGPDAAKAAYQQAVEATGGRTAGPHITYAESVLVMQQDLEGFQTLLETALAINPDEYVEVRLVNILAQRKARYLLDHTEDLFGG